MRIEYLARPGRTLDDKRLEALVAELRATAAACFAELPDYQCLRGTRAELEDKVITIAREADGTMAGFCSAVILPVRGAGDVLHLGLTCVRPTVRGGGMTHKLTSHLVVRYLLTHNPLGRQWITNVACVLSSLGNVALNFDECYPSPEGPEAPSRTHLMIAESVSQRYRDKAYILPEADFDSEAFVFRGSVKGTVFQKSAEDARYHHRDAGVNRYYLDRMAFDEGDEVLQVCSIRLSSIANYAFKRGRAWLARAMTRRLETARRTA